MTQVKAVRHKDIRGKELLYVVITTDKGEAIISVGQKTFDRVEEITTTEKPKLQKNEKTP